MSSGMSGLTWMVAVALVSALFWPQPLQARGDGLALARSNVCLGCHQLDARRVGPPFQSIARRYVQGGEREATVEYLMNSIRQGSRGKWGAIGMPAQPHVSERDARTLAEWLLDLAP